MPMKRNFTLNHATQKNNIRTEQLSSDLRPKESTLQAILQFAALYRVEKVSEQKFIEYLLN